MSALRFSLPELFYLFGAFHGIGLACFIVLVRRSYRANFYLALLIGLFSFYLFENSMFSSGYLVHFPHLTYASIPVLYLLGPLFYLYVRSLISLDSALHWKDVVHVMPLLIEVSILWKFYSLPASMKVQMLERIQQADYSFRFDLYFTGYLLYIFSSLTYLYISFNMLSRQASANVYQQSRVAWARQSGRLFFAYIIVSLLLSGLPFLSGKLRDLSYHLNLVLQTLLVQSLGYVAMIKPEVIREQAGKQRKYQLSSLDIEIMEQHKEKLNALMEAKELFLDPELTPASISKISGISKHHLSQVLSETLSTSFYDWVNGYRVERVKQLMQSENYKGEKILAIAFDSGFSSKSTFLRSFRKATGMKPTEYRESLVRDS